MTWSSCDSLIMSVFVCECVARIVNATLQDVLKSGCLHSMFSDLCTGGCTQEYRLQCFTLYVCLVYLCAAYRIVLLSVCVLAVCVCWQEHSDVV